MLKRLGAALSVPIFMLTSIGCGSDQQQIVSGFNFNVVDRKLGLNVEFSKETELNTEFHIPILQYGAVSLSPSNDAHGFTIGLELDLSYITDSDLFDFEKTRLLPNGQSMSTYVTEDVARIRIKASEQIGTSVYLGLDVDAMYVGAAVELNFLDKNFPSGLVISQRIRDKQQRDLGVVTLFGPKVENNQVVAPGGFFLITNVSQLMQYYPPHNAPAVFSNRTLVDNKSEILLPDDQTYIDEANRGYFSNTLNRYRLMKLYKKKVTEAGYAND